MSEYLRKILGAGKTPLIKSNPIAALTADAGPDIPGGEGANKGYWRKQLKDPRTKQFIEMGGGIVCTVTLPDGTVAKGTGTFKGNSSPGVAIIEFKGIKGIPDGKYNVPHENILGQADGIIPAKDLDRVLDKADGVIDDPKNILPPGTEMIDGTPEKPALKKAIEGEEALSIIKGEAALVAKEDGRFPIARGPQDIKTAAKRQYAKIFEVLKKENPELVKDFDSADAFWAHIEKNVAIDTSQRWMDSVTEIPELTKATNRIYAREILGLDPDGLITFYRNSINHHDNPDKAAAGYISLDQRMAWNYNSNKEQMGHDGRYIVKVKPDEVMGLIGYSKVPDEYGVVVGPDVTSQEGRYERVGDLAWTPLNPLMDPNKTQMGAGGDSWFRHFRPASSFDFPVMDSKPFEDGQGWPDFYKQFNLQKGDIPSKYDELYGEGAFDRDFPDSRGVPNYSRFVNNAFTEKNGKYAFDPLYLSTEFPMNSATSMEPNKGDELDLGLKFLSTIQELSGKTFMVHRSHNKNDSRLKDVKIEEPEAAVETPAVEAPEVETRSSDWANDEAWLQRATAEYEENRNLIGGDSTAATAFVPGDNLASDLEGSIVKAVPSKDPKKNFDVEVTKKTGLNAVSLYQRTVVIADINGVKVPFYLSTGQGGKKDVASGKWYPFFGASGGWLNKASGKYINNYYGSPELRAQAEWLDKNVGDIRNDTSIEIPVIRDQDTPEFLARLNADVHPIPNGEDEKVDILIKANVADIVKRVRMRPKDMFADPALSWDSLGGPTEGRGESELLDNLVDGDFLDVGSIKDGDVPRNFDLDELPEEQAKSLRYYKGSGFRFMNNFLRYGQEDMPEDQAALLRTEMSNLDELIDTYGDVYTETTVFRGMFNQEKILETDVSLVEMLESVKPGDIISDPGYTATTTNRAVAINEFGLGAGMPDDVDLKASQEQWRSTALFAIKLPEGSKALGLPLDSNYGAEAEVVLPRDAKLKINAIRRVAQVDADGEENGNYNYFVDAETVPAEAPQEEAATNKQVNALIRLYQEVEDGDAKDVIFKAVKDKENLTAARAKELLEADYSPKPVPEVPKEMAERFFNPKYGAGDSKTDVAMLPIDEVEKYIVQDRAGKDSWGASSDATIKKITEELENGGSIRDPLVIDFDDENNWGALAEGHHRLIAARQAGLKYVPVRILRAQGRNASFKNKGKGAPLTFSAGPDKFGYIPGAAHASLFDQFADKKPETPELEKKEPVAPTVDTFTEDEGKSLEYYSRGLDDTSTIVNTFLRMDRVFDPKALGYDLIEDSVGPDITDVGEDVIKNEDELNYVVDNANNAIYKYGRLENPTTLFRGMTEYKPDMLENLSVGDTISEPGFSSTSTDTSIAYGFASQGHGGNENHVIFQINAPKGAYGLRLGEDLYEKYPNFGGSNDMNGSEVLLPSNSKFKITEIRKEPSVNQDGKKPPGKYFYTVVADLIPQEPEIVEIKKPKAKKKKAPKNKSPFNIRLSEMEDLYEPDQDVLVYATVPKDVDDLKPGIEVSTDEDLANSLLKPDEKVLKFSVPAKDLIGIEERGEYDDLMVLYSPPEKEVESGGGFTLKPDPEDAVPEVIEPKKEEEPDVEPPVTHTFNGKTFDFSSEEMENAYYYVSQGAGGAKDVSDEEGKDFNERMRALTDYLRPGRISDETIAGQEKLLGPGTKIKVGELRHSAPPARFDEIMKNGIRPKITDKVGSERYKDRRFGVFMANDYTSSEAGKLADVFRIKVPENELRVDSGYTPYAQNLYIERTIKPQEFEYLGHVPAVNENDESNDFGLHDGRGTECTICNPELKSLELEKESGPDAPLTPQVFTDEQEKVVKDYSSYGYRDVNTYLRLGRQAAIDEFDTTNSEKRADKAEKAIEEINKVFETSTLEKDATLFRLVPRDIAEGVKVGDILSDPAILSTTKNPESDDINRQFNSNIFNGLERYYEDRYDGAHPNDVGWAVIEIEAPAGTKAIDISSISEFPAEREVLLPPGASLKVISIEETEVKNRYKRPGDIFKAYKVKVRAVPPNDAPELMKDWDAKTGLETTTAKPIKGRKPGFENWNSQIPKLLAGKQESDPIKGDIVQHKFIKEAGFNGKPTILSQADFDALEGETLYRGVLSKDHIQHYKESEVQYASTGSFGNGTYSSNKESEAALYTGADLAAARADRIMEMKLLPDANIFDIPSSKVPDIGGPQYLDFIYELYDEFMEQYKKSGANPAEIQAADWAFKGYTGWTNIAIMKGIDAIRFKAPMTTDGQYYTIILNRGKVAINGKS